MEAFTLAELLVGGSLSVLVVSALGAIALLSELRMGREAEVNQNLRDNWGRALNFIATDAQQAYWIKTAISTYPCEGALPSSPLVLEGPPDPTKGNQPRWTVVYGVRSNDGTSANEWRGFNRLVRCGPPFVDGDPDPANQTIAGNLDLQQPPVESVVADQLSDDEPFKRSLFDEWSDRDRDAKVELKLKRRSGPGTYPPDGTFNITGGTQGSSTSDYQTQIRASRNPGFDVVGNPLCVTTTSNGNEEPPAGPPCTTSPPGIKDSLGRVSYFKEYNLPASGDFTVNGCEPVASCKGPKFTNTTEVIFLKGNFADFTRQFSKTDTQPLCSRISCYVSNGSQSVQIYDGNVLVFYDRILRL